MKNINSYRKFERNGKKPNTDGDYILYWMQINRRNQYNYALEYAVALANKYEKPLLIYESVMVNYPWASDRFHAFLLEGMKEHLDELKDSKVSHYCYAEQQSGTVEQSFYDLAENAVGVVADEYPVYIIRENNEQMAGEIDVPYISVDSNGIIPLKITDKDPYSAYLFRKVMQKHFLEAYNHPPKKDPLDDLEHHEKVKLPKGFEDKYPRADEILNDIPGFISTLDINHDIGITEQKGTRQYALGKLGDFIAHGLSRYDEERNDPDSDAASGLSPWLHFGLISEYEIVKAVLAHQPEGWELEDITPNNGKRSGFFGGDPNVESFLDEVITWREVGFHFAHHRADYDQFESLPDWVLETLSDHQNDEREWVYELEEFAESKTHDEIWNAAQTQLRETGIMQNYLRMLWGKKIIEWTKDYRTALDYMIELNNRYALDGRDPNSYSGIFWCFGRFDRPWQERPIYGKLRYMTSESTRKKLKLDRYLKKYGNQKSLL